MTDREKAIVMAYTGIAMLKGDKLNVFYKYLEELYDRPVFTHELATLDIAERAKLDFIKLCEETPDKRTETHECDFGKWMMWPDKRPDHPGLYIVSGGGKVWLCEYLEIGNMSGGWSNNINNPCVRAWMPLPEPYREDEE